MRCSRSFNVKKIPASLTVYGTHFVCTYLNSSRKHCLLSIFAQLVNHHLAVLKVDPPYILYTHCSNYVIPVYMSKHDTFCRVYNDLAGYGSLKQTLQDAREVDPSVRLDDVRRWMEENTKRKQQLKGQNSFVGNGPYHEYQVDLMYIKHLTDQQYEAAMVCADAFTTYASVVPVKGNAENDVALGVIESIVNMGRNPQVIYIDGESSVRNSKLFQEVFHRTQDHSTLQQSHHALAERFIGTFKSMLDRRIKPGQNWTQLIYPILLTYNNKLIHSATEMTPKVATKPENELNANVNIKLKAKHSRRYPVLSVGDKVHIYTKRKPFDKSHVSVWSDASYTVEGISRSHGLTFY